MKCVSAPFARCIKSETIEDHTGPVHEREMENGHMVKGRDRRRDD